ncbi:hyaluronidase-5-like [Amia ocellicauda]|uniref:hyaluronidase-5-like n=1 Tax=Amia ocellicauda TaxID=2972642 RepID=UPI003464A453
MELFTRIRKKTPPLSALLFVTLLENLYFSHGLPPTASPLFDGRPFVVVWNAPTPACKANKITLDLAAFAAVTTPGDDPGQDLTLFYHNRLGLYPYVNEETKQEFYGGIPQQANMAAHLKHAQEDTAHYIPSETATGLAVIDWESWRPLWLRNWGSKQIYKTLSVAYAKKLDPSLSEQQATEVAKAQFQVAAKEFMAKTLEQCSTQRPKQLWGYYLFPNCYNYGYNDASKVYTGECSDLVKSRNDELLWLWQGSSALYPSVYLPAALKDTDKAALYVRNRVQEAMRVAALPKRSSTAPIYAFNRPVFTDKNKEFLEKIDLVHSIGESAAVGASGAILWGASADFNDKASCEALSAYLENTLSPYIANVSAAAKLCSSMLCQDNGRCVRKNYDSSDYLQLNPAHFQVQRGPHGKYLATGLASADDLSHFANKFTCQCFEGKSCQARLPDNIPRTEIVIEV